MGPTVVHQQTVLRPQALTFPSLIFHFTQSSKSSRTDCTWCGWSDPVMFMSTSITDNFPEMTFMFRETSVWSEVNPHAWHYTCTNNTATAGWCETAASLWKCHRGVLSRRALCATLHSDTEETQPAALQTCEGFMWLRAVLWCGEVCWGWALPNKRLRRWRETVVSLVVAADEVRSQKFTAPGKSRQGPSTVAWPLWKPPAHCVITICRAL